MPSSEGDQPHGGRRACLSRALALAAGLSGWGLQAVAQEDGRQHGQGQRTLRLAAAWRGPSVGDVQQAGILELPAEGSQVRIAAAQELPGRAHGLTPLADGGFVVVAFRPGDWLLRLDGQARVVARGGLSSAGRGRAPLHYSGHAVCDASGQWLHATACDAATGQGWIAVHRLADLRLEAVLPSGGIEPHQLLLDANGRLMVAHGGIRRSPDGRRLRDMPIQAALDRLDASTGQTLARWTLPDAELSIRHMAFEAAPATESDPAPKLTLGLALQAEHADPALRQAAPCLACWDGSRLQAVEASGGLGGVAGDIAALPTPRGTNTRTNPGTNKETSADETRQAHGPFVLSQASGGLAWRSAPDDEPPQVIARLREAGALAAVLPDGRPDDAFGGVWIAAGRGLARWHPGLAPRLLAWPQPLAPDNHLAWLAAPT